MKLKSQPSIFHVNIDGNISIGTEIDLSHKGGIKGKMCCRDRNKRFLRSFEAIFSLKFFPRHIFNFCILRPFVKGKMASLGLSLGIPDPIGWTKPRRSLSPIRASQRESPNNPASNPTIF
jgi:hypothetical protein